MRTRRMAARLIFNRIWLKSFLWESLNAESRNNTGMTRSLQIIVDKAMVSTITIPVAADSPPINTNRVNAL